MVPGVCVCAYMCVNHTFWNLSGVCSFSDFFQTWFPFLHSMVPFGSRCVLLHNKLKPKEWLKTTILLLSMILWARDVGRVWLGNSFILSVNNRSHLVIFSWWGVKDGFMHIVCCFVSDSWKAGLS